MAKTKKTELKIIISAVEKGVKQTIRAVSEGFKRGTKSLKAFNRTAAKGSSVTSGLTGKIKGLVAAYLGFRTVIGAINILKEADQAAFNLQSSVAAANREFDNIGSVDEWGSAILRLSEYLKIYSDTSLKNAISRTVDMTKRLGLSREQMETVIKRSGDLGAGKVELTGAIERVTAALRGEAEASEYLGLTLNENYVKAWFEANKETKKAWKNLTDLEKAQVRYNVFLEQTNDLVGRAGNSVSTLSGAWDSIVAAMVNAITRNDEVMSSLTVLSKVLDDNSEKIGALVKLLVGWSVEIVKFFSMIPYSLQNTYNYIDRFITKMEINRLKLVKATKEVKSLSLADTSDIDKQIAAKEKHLEIIERTKEVVADVAFLSKKSAETHVDAEDKKSAATKKTTEAIRASGKALDAVGKKAQAAYGKAVDAAKKYADQVIAFEEKIKYARLSTEDKVRELARKGLSDEQQYADKKLQAEEKLNAAKEALRNKDFKLAEKHAQAAQGMYADLAVEVKRQTEGGESVVAKTIEQTKQVAIAGVQAAGSVMEQIFSQQKAGAQAMQDQWQQTADKIRAMLTLLSDAREAKITITAEGLETIAQQIDALVNDPKEAKLSITANAAQFEDKIIQLENGTYKNVKVPVKADAGPFKEEIIRLLDGTYKNVKVPVTADAGPFKEEIVQLADGTYTNVMVKVDADTKPAEKALSEFKRQGEGMSITAQVKAVTGKATAAINAIKKALASIKDKTVTVTVKYKRKGQAANSPNMPPDSSPPVQQKAAGGFIRKLAAGAKLFGYGGGDKIKALLEAGEHVTRKEAVRWYDDRLFPALNSMRIPKADIAKLLGRQAFKTGGPVNPTEAMTITLNAGTASMPMTVLGASKITRAMVHQFESELRKLGLARS